MPLRGGRRDLALELSPRPERRLDGAIVEIIQLSPHRHAAGERGDAGAAAVQRWRSVAAGPIAFGPATARLITVFGAKHNAEEVIGRAHALLKVMNAELADRPFLVGGAPTIADVAGYTYIAHAPEGNVALTDYPHVRAWLARIEALPGFVPMQKTAVGLAA